MQAAPISSSFFGNALAALSDSASSAPAPPAPAELSSRYFALSGLSGAKFTGHNFGVQRGSNLIFFVMETASIEFLDTRKGMPAHPVLDTLRDRVYIANNHFSTFPASAESNLSILTGAYPPRAIYGTCLIDVPRNHARLPGPISQLADLGYHTAIYAPYRSQVPADKVVFEGTGFAAVNYGELLSGDGNPEQRSFEKFKSDISTWSSRGEPFAVSFLPQLGHGPWPAVLGDTIAERGNAVVRKQLDWLASVVETLKRNGQLNNTVIIITGDHGVRTLTEDPRVRVGMIDSYAFHVPLLIYAPKADYKNLSSSLPSSHVDIAPEIGELFGLAHLQSYQGLALNNPERSKRRSFLMAGWYYGANGYRDQNEAAMYSELLNSVYARSDGKMAFNAQDIETNDRHRQEIRSTISAMNALQEGWIASRVCPSKR